VLSFDRAFSRKVRSRLILGMPQVIPFATLVVVLVSCGLFRVIRQTSTGPSQSAMARVSSPDSPDDGLARKDGDSQKQPLDAFLVVDVEATCEQNARFGYPNEIIVRLHCLPTRTCTKTPRNGQSVSCVGWIRKTGVLRDW
jgi:hypothetical protein